MVKRQVFIVCLFSFFSFFFFLFFYSLNLRMSQAWNVWLERSNRYGGPFKWLHRPTCKEAAQLRESIWQLSPVGLVCTTGHQARTLRANEREPLVSASVFPRESSVFVRYNFFHSDRWKNSSRCELIVKRILLDKKVSHKEDTNWPKLPLKKAQWHAWIPRATVTSHWAGRSSAKNKILKVLPWRRAGTIKPG